MRRRDFLSLVGGAFATWPLSARAQQDGNHVISMRKCNAREKARYAARLG
jgi:uncharacterized DUF497 family protein